MMDINTEIAYETGVHIGDGNMYSYKNRIYRITYCGNLSNEKEFYLGFVNLLKRNYQVNPIITERKKDNTIILTVNSKKLFEFKKDKLNLPIGKKTEIRIPENLMERELLKNVLKGIGDTDFSLSFKKNKKGLYTEPRLEFYTRYSILANQVFNILRDLIQMLHKLYNIDKRFYDKNVWKKKS
ncbi:MAG: hypothetical protein QXP01_07690 [Candidatus Hadarchaeum sp.]